MQVNLCANHIYILIQMINHAEITKIVAAMLGCSSHLEWNLK